MPITNVRRLREGLFLINWSELYYTVSKERVVKLFNDESHSSDCTLKYSGFGTPNMDFSLALSESYEKLFNFYEVPVVSVTKNSTSQFMDFQSNNLWTTSWKILVKECSRCHSGKCLGCGVRARPSFTVEVLIDFQPSTESAPYLTNGQSNVLRHLSSLFDDQTFADVTFKVKSETLKAHSNILASGSAVLSTMFQQDFIEGRSKTVEINDTEPQVFKQLLQYLYTGRADLFDDEDMAHDLLMAADKYGVESLKEECANVLQLNLQVENATRTLITANLHSSLQLYEATLSFIAKNGKSMCSRPEWFDLMRCYPTICFQATQLMLTGS
jgi:hypothetical protein